MTFHSEFSFISNASMKASITLLPFALLAFHCGQTHAEEAATNIEQAWDMVWTRFYLPQVQTFGDYLSSYDQGKEQAHLPTADEVKRQYPNPCGYSTGMEDGAILGGAMLRVLCDRFEVTNDELLREKAASVFAGLQRCVTVHGVCGSQRLPWGRKERLHQLVTR